MKMAKLLIFPVLALCFSAHAGMQNLYPEPNRAEADITAALQTAKSAHKRVILDFGGNWCTDCHVLDIYFHDASNEPLLDANFVLVHVNIGRMDRNVGLTERYQIPLREGVPALAVLDTDGKLLFSQKTGEFKAMRGMQSEAVGAFLNEWKPASHR